MRHCEIAFENNEDMPETFGSGCIVTGQENCLQKFLKTAKRMENNGFLQETTERTHTQSYHFEIYPLSVNTNYRTAKNFRQRKISSKATVRQFVRNLFSSNVGRRLLLFDHSVVALLLIVYLHIHEY